MEAVAQFVGKECMTGPRNMCAGGLTPLLSLLSLITMNTLLSCDASD